MSRLRDLLREVEQQDVQLAADLREEVKALESRRAFGLNFERHVPETVELPGRPVRKGDKVRFLPTRGEPENSVERSLWLVKSIRREGKSRIADLIQRGRQTEAPQTASRVVDDLVVVAEFRDAIYPGLVSTGRVARGGAKPYHSVINAENYHALQALLYTHEGKVDTIYIDPPYNTRDKDWKYNNDYVDSDDSYKHSKWLAFIERRLKLAKRLLKPTCSALIVTIDNNEYGRLLLLVEQIFPEGRITNISVVINPKSTPENGFGRVEEYLIVIELGAAYPSRVFDPLHGQVPSSDSVRVRWRGLTRTGFYPVSADG